MSFNSNNRGLQRYLIESATQKQGEYIKNLIKNAHKLIGKIKGNYSTEDIASLKTEINEIQNAIIILERIEPSSHHERMEHSKLIEIYGKEMEKLRNNVSGLQQTSNTEEKIMAVAFEDDTYAEKEKKLKEVYKSIVEINTMIKDCAEVVGDQGKDLDSIENFVEISSDATKDAVTELDQANKYQQSGSSRCTYMIFIITLILLAVLLIFYFL